MVAVTFSRQVERQHHMSREYSDFLFRFLADMRELVVFFPPTAIFCGFWYVTYLVFTGRTKSGEMFKLFCGWFVAVGTCFAAQNILIGSGVPESIATGTALLFGMAGPRGVELLHQKFLKVSEVRDDET